MATITTVVPNNISANEERGAVLLRFIAGEALKPGQAVYQDSNQKVWKAIALTSAHAQAIGIVATTDNFYGEDTVNAGDWATICVGGPVQGFKGLVNGEPLWIDKTTAGILNDAAPTGAYQFQIGNALGSDTIFVRPGTASPVSA